jgi:hypothetical protein
MFNSIPLIGSGYFPEDFQPASFELYHPHVVSLENETVELDLVGMCFSFSNSNRYRRTRRL